MQERVPKKKLLITASTFPRYEGDTEPRFVLDLAKEQQKYYDVTVLVPSAPGTTDEEVLEGVRVERYHYLPVHKWETLCYPGAIVPRIKENKIRILQVPFLFLGLYRAVKKRIKNYDCVHAHWIIPQGIVQSFLKAPYLLTGHGGDVTSLNIGIIKWLKKRAVRKAERITVVSSALKRELLELFGDEEQQRIEEKVAILPMGCCLDKFNTREDKTKNAENGEKKTVLFVGRLAEKKGVAYLISAMEKVEAKLVIVGDGPLRSDLMQQTEELKLQDKVTFLGAKSHEELPAIYASADMLVVPSVTAKDKDKEGFGLVILEAMAAGVPIVASDSGGITEIIRDEYNGLLVKERDSEGLAKGINRLLEDAELREYLTKNMRETAERYDYRVVGKQYAELIKEIEL